MPVTDVDRAAWQPDADTIERANLTAAIREQGLSSYAELHEWSIDERGAFWGMVLDRLGIVFDEAPERILDGPPRDPLWLPGARLNIVDSCFTAPGDKTAVVFRAGGANHAMSYSELRRLVDEFAHGLSLRGVGAGDGVAIAMPMTVEAVAAYLGTVAVGARVISIADSFAPHEIATRLRMTDPSLVVTQDRFVRAGREHAMFDKVTEAGARRCVVVETGAGIPLRDGDVAWNEFLIDAGPFDPVPCAPDGHVNVLFSSGTTGEPKAIPWTHLTAIKSAMDGHFHHDIHRGDVVAWPTNLGWVLGPWLIFASLINDATMALYDDAPTGRGFIDFVREAGVTMLGFVPSIVAAWRANRFLDGANWRDIRVLSSSGEASSPDEYAWLMDAAGGVPVIEYCGGTEIGGGYIAGTVLHDAIPATFTTPALGLDVRILDDDGHPADIGEMYVVPPSFGLSQELIGRDHYDVYYAGVPESDVPLRRHGDHMERLPNGYYRALGRTDDTMNLGGVKVSSAELERVVGVIDGVSEVAAVGVRPPGGGPSRLVIYAVPEPGVAPDPGVWSALMQQAIRSELNPIFRIDDVIIVGVLPRTASAKITRRELRARHE
jgi:acetyl-CoA synthetase